MTDEGAQTPPGSGRAPSNVCAGRLPTAVPLGPAPGQVYRAQPVSRCAVVFRRRVSPADATRPVRPVRRAAGVGGICGDQIVTAARTDSPDAEPPSPLTLTRPDSMT